jgi:hypothetical protein
MARQPQPALRPYEQQTAPNARAAPLFRPVDVGSAQSGIGQALMRAGGAVQQAAQGELEVERVQQQRREEDARIVVTQRMAEFRREANELRRRTFEEAEDGWRGADERFAQGFGELSERYMADERVNTAEARNLLTEQIFMFQQTASDVVAEQREGARQEWQADTTRAAIDAGGNVLIADPDQYEAMREDVAETIEGISNANLRRDTLEYMEENYARYAVSGLIQRNPSAALRALEDPEAEGPYARMSPAGRAQAITAARTEIDRRRAVYTSHLRERMAVEADMLDVGVPVENPVSVEQVRGAFGDRAAQAWGIRLQAANERQAMLSASVIDLMSVRNEAPDTSSLEARSAQLARQQAAEQVLTAIGQDPMAYLVRSGQVGAAPTDLEAAFAQAVQDPTARVRTASGPQSPWQAFLRVRASTAAQAAQSRGIPARVFTEDEASEIAGRMRGLTPTQQASVLSQMRAALGGSGPLYDVALAQITPGGGASRVAGAYINAPNGGNVIAGRILEGQALLAGAPTPTGERAQRFALPSESDMRSAWQRATGAGAMNAYRGLPEAEAADFAAFQALYAAEASRAGRFSGDIDSNIARRVAGQVINSTRWSGRPVLMPPGFTPQRFSQTVRERYATLATRGGDLEGRDAEDFDLVPLGSGVYRLQIGNAPALDGQSRQVLLSVSQ